MRRKSQRLTRDHTQLSEEKLMKKKRKRKIRLHQSVCHLQHDTARRKIFQVKPKLAWLHLLAQPRKKKKVHRSRLTHVIRWRQLVGDREIQAPQLEMKIVHHKRLCREFQRQGQETQVHRQLIRDCRQRGQGTQALFQRLTPIVWQNHSREHIQIL